MEIHGTGENAETARIYGDLVIQEPEEITCLRRLKALERPEPETKIPGMTWIS